MKVYSYVILDNQFHSTVSGINLRQTISSIKSFTARTVIDEPKIEAKECLLYKLHYYKLQHKTNSEYLLWQEGFHPQIIYSEEVFRQKTEYIHTNPLLRG